MYKTNLFDTVKSAKSVVISGHTNPDGDAVSAAFALALALNQKGIEPKVLLEGYAERFNYLKGSEYLYTGDFDALKADVFVAVDCGDKARLTKGAEAVFDNADVTYNFDHHISNDSFAQNNVVNPKASSASEVVYEIIKDVCVIDKDIATAVYSGIVYDTSGFKHNSTSPRTHEIASELVAIGVDTPFIHSKMLYEHSFSQLKVMSKALTNAKFDMDYGISYSALTLAELDECGAQKGDTDGVAEYLLNITGIDVSLLMTQREPGKTKISLRSKKYDVNKVASFFGGGGHILAAGASVDGEPAQVVDMLVAKIREEIDNEKGE